MAAEAEAASLDAAAIMVQKRYRGHRARRKLADAAIMAKSYGWWNLVDSVILQEHTEHYYAHSESWKALDNWKRLNRKAAKVGKGLSKDNKALKLALQHWLEAVDPRHRYGHNLRPYYLHWHKLDTHEPFFYWLDVGDGRRVDLPKCSRAKLAEQMINYLSPEQRKHYLVDIFEGRLIYRQTRELVHTTDGDNSDDRWIFVMSPYGKLYIGKKQRGVFQHSSFLAGGATIAAGRLSAHHGVLQPLDRPKSTDLDALDRVDRLGITSDIALFEALDYDDLLKTSSELMEAHSGHYRPSPENFESLIRTLIEKGADLSLAKVHLVSDDVSEKTQGRKLAGEVREAIKEVVTDERVQVKVENQSLLSVDSGLELDTVLSFPAADAAADAAAAASTSPETKAAKKSKVAPSVDGGLELQAVAAFRGAGKEAKKGKAEPQSVVPGIKQNVGFSRISSLADIHPDKREEALRKYVMS